MWEGPTGGLPTSSPGVAQLRPSQLPNSRCQHSGKDTDSDRHTGLRDCALPRHSPPRLRLSLEVEPAATTRRRPASYALRCRDHVAAGDADHAA